MGWPRVADRAVAGRRQTKRSRSASGRRRPLPSSSAIAAGLEVDAGREAAEPGRPEPAALAPGQLAGPIRTQSRAAAAGRSGRRDRRRASAGRPRSPTSRPSSAANRPATGPAIGRRTVPSRIEHGERGQRLEARPLARLGGRQVAQVLAGEPGRDDPADARRPGPDDRLRVDPAVDDEDRAGPSDVERAAQARSRRPPARPGRGPGSRRQTPRERRPGQPKREPATRDRLDARSRRPAPRAGRRGRPPRSASDRRPGWSSSPAGVRGWRRRSGPPASWPSPGHQSPARERRAVALAPAGDRRTVVHPGIALALGQPEPGADDVAGGHEDPVARAELEPGDRARRSSSRRAGTSSETRRSRPAVRRARASRHPVRPAQNAACQASSIARRRSARSGSRSGMSRRSTSRPPSPPPTSTLSRRPRVPSPTGSRKRRSTVATWPGGRSTSWRPPGTRSSLGLAGRRRDRQPPGAPAGPQALRDDDAAERREQVVGQLGDERAALGRILDRRRAGRAAGRGRRRAGWRPVGGRRRRSPARWPDRERPPSRRRPRR